MSKQNKLNIGLDIDGVLCCFSEGVVSRAKRMGLEKGFPTCWTEVTHWGMGDNFTEIMKDAWLDPQFWLDLPPLPGAKELDFTPACYITSRPIDTEITKQWLTNNGFPEAEVITVKQPLEKLQHIVERNLDLFVDDHYQTIQHLIENNVNAVLYKAPYQRGHAEECKNLPTIECLKEVYNYVGHCNRIQRCSPSR